MCILDKYLTILCYPLHQSSVIHLKYYRHLKMSWSVDVSSLKLLPKKFFQQHSVPCYSVHLFSWLSRTCVSIVQHNILEKRRMLWHSLESQTSIYSSISSSDKFIHYSLLFCYFLSFNRWNIIEVDIFLKIFIK